MHIITHSCKSRPRSKLSTIILSKYNYHHHKFGTGLASLRKLKDGNHNIVKHPLLYIPKLYFNKPLTWSNATFRIYVQSGHFCLNLSVAQEVQKSKICSVEIILRLYGVSHIYLTETAPDEQKGTVRYCDFTFINYLMNSLFSQHFTAEWLRSALLFKPWSHSFMK